MDSGAWIVAGGAVGATAALLGGVVDRSYRSRSEFIGAAAEWLAAIEAFSQAVNRDAELSVGPSNPIAASVDRFLESVVDAIGRGRIEGLRMLVYRSHVARLDQVTDRLMLATTRLLLTAPEGLVNRIAPHTTHLFTAVTPDQPQPRLNDDARNAIATLLGLWTRPFWRHPIRWIRARLQPPAQTEDTTA